MEATTQSAINSVSRAVSAVLRQLGQAQHDLVAIDTESLGENSPILNYPTMGIWVGYGAEFTVKRRTIIGPKELPAFAVGYYKTERNYPHAPDETEEVESYRGTSVRDTVAAVFALFCGDIYDRWAEGEESL